MSKGLVDLSKSAEKKNETEKFISFIFIMGGPHNKAEEKRLGTANRCLARHSPFMHYRR